MEQQSAVEWLYEKISQTSYVDIEYYVQAKKMEKEQIVVSFYQGACQESDTHGAQNLDMKDAENYYNETFKTK